MAPVSNLMHASVATGTTDVRRKFKFGNVSADTARHYTNSAPRHFVFGAEPPPITSGSTFGSSSAHGGTRQM